MGEVQFIEKGERNAQQGFSFRGIDSVLGAVGPALREHGVVIIPTAEHIELERYDTKKGGQMQGAIVRMRYTVYGPAGDSFTGAAYGQAADSGDKAVSKAQSVAYRTFLLQGLTVPTNEPDPDAYSHERESARQAAEEARKHLLAVCEKVGISPGRAMSDFASDYDDDIRTTTNVEAIRALAQRYSMAGEMAAAE
ncbi:ERF family protein [Nocardia nova]|nr:ERF family protein [Nocardia nova]